MAVPEILRWLSSLQQQHLELKLKKSSEWVKSSYEAKKHFRSIKHLNYQFAAGMDPKACV
jgi:hypothetical protein